MEEIILNIDSRYRNSNFYPNKGKFIYNLDKIYKNIISVKMASMEIDNTIQYGENCMFLKVNDWGYIELSIKNKSGDSKNDDKDPVYYKNMLSKILLIKCQSYTKIDDYVNKEYRFRQPIDISKLDIELVNYDGTAFNLKGTDWSFTLELKQLVNSLDKTVFERNALVFNNMYKS
jgi:hypothetical protein